MMQRRRFGVAAIATALASVGCAPTHAEGLWFISGPSGESVVLQGSGFGGSWLRRRSLEDGALLASAWLFVSVIGKNGYNAECTLAVPGRFWCLENGNGIGDRHGLRVRDTESLEVIAEQDEMLGRTPALAGEPRLRAGSVDPKTHGFRFESRDGYKWTIDPTTLIPSRFEGAIKAETKPDDSSRSRCAGVEVGSDCYGFAETGTRRRPLARNGEAIHPEHTYLAAGFGPPVENWPRLLVVEDALDHGATLWCLFPNGTVDWSVTNSSVRELLNTRFAKLYRDTVVIATRRELIALRQRDGTVVWTSRW